MQEYQMCRIVAAKQCFFSQDFGVNFLDRQTLKEEAGELFHRETGVLEAPMLIRVADQVRRCYIY